MKGSSDRKGLSSMSVRASETTGTHLAHWPPPQRGKESKPVFVKHARAGDVPAARLAPDARDLLGSPTTNSGPHPAPADEGLERQPDDEGQSRRSFIPQQQSLHPRDETEIAHKARTALALFSGFFSGFLPPVFISR